MTKEQILVLKERTSIVFNNEVTLFKRSNLKEVYDNFRNKKLVYFFENEIVDIDSIDFAKEEDIEKYIAGKEDDLNDLKGNLMFGIDLSKEQFLKAKKEIYNKLYYSMNEFYNLIFKYVNTINNPFVIFICYLLNTHNTLSVLLYFFPYYYHF